MTNPQIDPEMMRLYLKAYDKTLGRSQIMSCISLASKMTQNENMRDQFLNTFDLKPIIRPIPVHWLLNLGEAVHGIFKEQTPNILMVVGFRWLNTKVHTFEPSAYAQETDMKDGFGDMISEAIRSHYSENPESDNETYLFIALEALAQFFIRHFYCEITVSRYNVDDNLFIFEIKNHHFAPNDDERFLLFRGLISRFNDWFSSSSITFITNKEMSTHNRIIIKNSYRR